LTWFCSTKRKREMILEAFEIISKFRKVQKVRKRSTVPTERWKKTATIWDMNFDTDKHKKRRK